MASITVPASSATTGRLVVLMLGVWFAAVFGLGAAGVFSRPEDEPPLPILLGVLLPIVLFAAAYRALPAFRGRVLAADLPLLTALQAWRAGGGFGFLALHAHGVLPGSFAWPAGVGDMLIGATAPFVAMALVRDPAFVHSRSFVAWNLLGILDFVVAIGMGALSAGLFPQISGAVTTAPMSLIPLVLVPAYLVPFFVMLHIVALVRARR